MSKRFILVEEVVAIIEFANDLMVFLETLVLTVYLHLGITPFVFRQ